MGNHNASTVLVQIGWCGRICCFIGWEWVYVVNSSGAFPLTPALSPKGRGGKDRTVQFPLPLGRGLGLGGKLLITSPNHHHLIALMLAHEAIPLFQRQRGLLAFTYRGMAGAELTQRLPVGDG